MPISQHRWYHVQANFIGRSNLRPLERFHHHIYRIADHDLMFQMWELLRNKADRFGFLSSEFFAELIELAKIHEPILQAFYNQNVEEGIKAFEVHLNFIRNEMFNHETLGGLDTTSQSLV